MNIKRIQERRKKYVEINKLRRRELMNQHKCIICKVDCKPVIIYHQYCEEHIK